MDDQPQPTTPARPRMKWLRWLAVPAAVAVLVLVYQLTRPPSAFAQRSARRKTAQRSGPRKLVTWRTAPLFGTNKRFKLLIPQGWEVDEAASNLRDSTIADFILVQHERRPARRSISSSGPIACIILFVKYAKPPMHINVHYWRLGVFRIYPERGSQSIHAAGFDADLTLHSRDSEYFTHVRDQILNSLTIE